jgi:SAM-dependent methyltransferase
MTHAPLDKNTWRTQEHLWNEWADVYDEIARDVEASGELEYLTARLPAGCSVLELACGTGRVALRLAAMGYEVEGLDASPKMLEILKRQDPSGRVGTMRADFASFKSPKRFDCIICMYNGFLYAASVARQRAVLRCARDHLSGEGTLILEVTSPVAVYREWAHNSRVVPAALEGQLSWMMAGRLDPASQQLHVSQLRIPGLRQYIHEMRYVWKDELCLMAELEGYGIRAIYGGFDRSPYDMGSPILLAELVPKD